MKIILLIMSLIFASYCIANDSPVESNVKYWEVEKDGILVKYNKDACGSLSKNILLNVYHDSEAGEFNWDKMENRQFKNKVLKVECSRLRNEMLNRSLKDTILNKEVK